MIDLIFNAIPSTTNMMPVLKLFLIPVGGGIPAGVMLAQTKGVAWPAITLLYLVSDIILAFAFEPVLRLIKFICGKITFLARISAMLKAATARSASHFSGAGAGPIGLIMIAFGVDPMTGRASALAAGHGFLAGWAIAIVGDMLYFAIIAICTLRLNTIIRDPNITMWIILAAMFVMPMLIGRIRRSSRLLY